MAMPDEIKSAFGFALHLAQQGKKHQNAKPLKGFLRPFTLNRIAWVRRHRK
jgi:phage-related protein